MLFSLLASGFASEEERQAAQIAELTRFCRLNWGIKRRIMETSF